MTFKKIQSRHLPVWALILFCFCHSIAAHAQMLQLVVKSRIEPMPNSKTWGKTSEKDLFFPLHFHTPVKPSYLLIGRDHPNGLRFLAIFSHDGVNLPLKFAKEFQGISEGGELQPGYFIQVAEHKFDHEGSPEIIIAIGNGLTDLSINVIKYHAPQSARDAAREANWSIVGSYSGQAKAEIIGDTLQLPYGSQGLYEEYTWAKDKFLKTE